PAGPVARTARNSTPSSRASRRVAGVAGTGPTLAPPSVAIAGADAPARPAPPTVRVVEGSPSSAAAEGCRWGRGTEVGGGVRGEWGSEAPRPLPPPPCPAPTAHESSEVTRNSPTFTVLPGWM